MAARALANRLGRPLFRIDLATIVSKWIGETEKNLRNALDAAEIVGAVLLFDEGEALLGSRGEVQRGADRYANLEVAYLLQALELHDGVVVVTTNTRDKIDRAFIRRFDVVLDLPRPSAVEREGIWRRELGVTASSRLDATLRDVARRSDLTGGHIAAAARYARALALDEGSELIEPRHLLRAVAREHEKVGSNLAGSRWRREAGEG